MPEVLGGGKIELLQRTASGLTSEIVFLRKGGKGGTLWDRR